MDKNERKKRSLLFGLGVIHMNRASFKTVKDADILKQIEGLNDRDLNALRSGQVTFADYVEDKTYDVFKRTGNETDELFEPIPDTDGVSKPSRVFYERLGESFGLEVDDAKHSVSELEAMGAMQDEQFYDNWEKQYGYAFDTDRDAMSEQLSDKEPGWQSIQSVMETILPHENKQKDQTPVVSDQVVYTHSLKDTVLRWAARDRAWDVIKEKLGPKQEPTYTETERYRFERNDKKPGLLRKMDRYADKAASVGSMVGLQLAEDAEFLRGVSGYQGMRHAFSDTNIPGLEGVKEVIRRQTTPTREEKAHDEQVEMDEEAKTMGYKDIDDYKEKIVDQAVDYGATSEQVDEKIEKDFADTNVDFGPTRDKEKPFNPLSVDLNDDEQVKSLDMDDVYDEVEGMTIKEQIERAVQEKQAKAEKETARKERQKARQADGPEL